MSRVLRRTFTLAATVAALVLADSAVAAPSDNAFLKKALEGDNSETRLGQIAERKGASAGVREFGRMLSQDHSKAKVDATPVLKAHGVPVTDEMAPEARTEATKLDGLSGAAFDREFAQYMVRDHRKDIADFEKEARTGDQQTASMARQTLPVLRKHLATAERLAR
jgi:putative membrane protein